MKRQAILAIVATVMCSAAFGEYDYFRNAQYPVGLRPDVGLDKVEQEGGPDATGYKKRTVQWWPKRGVDVVDVPEGAVYRTWTLDTEKDGLLGEFRFRRKWGTEQPRQFKAPAGLPWHCQRYRQSVLGTATHRTGGGTAA